MTAELKQLPAALDGLDNVDGGPDKRGDIALTAIPGKSEIPIYEALRRQA